MNEEFKSLTIDAFRQKFSTIEQCIDYLASCKWGNGYSCRQCGHTSYCKGAHYGDRQCTRCNKIESAKANTLFHSMKIPLDQAFYMLYLIVIDKKGCPSTQLARQTGLQLKTCLLFRRKVMMAMTSNDIHPLEGEVDVVTTTVSIVKADKHGKKRPRKVKVLIGIEKKGGGAARSYVKVIGRASARKAKAFIGKKIDSQATINMDEAARRCCNGHCIMPGEGPDKALAHRVVTNMINWLYARHGHVTYLQDYLNEYCYRYNRHRMKGEILDDIISRMVRHRPMTGKISACR